LSRGNSTARRRKAPGAGKSIHTTEKGVGGGGKKKELCNNAAIGLAMKLVVQKWRGKAQIGKVGRSGVEK